MSKTKQARATSAHNGHSATNGAPAPRKPGRPKKLVAGPVDAKVIAMPGKGPGRRRIVPADSIDGLAARAANELGQELAARIVPKLREMAEAMVRQSLDRLLTNLK